MVTKSSGLEEVRELYTEHAGDLHGYIARRLGSDLADDVLADTFRQAIEDWDSYDAALGEPRNWLYGIATNLVRRHWRTERRRRAALDRLTPELTSSQEDATASRLDAANDAEPLLAAVARLGEDDYDLLVLTAWEHMSSADAAEVLGIAPGTVRSRLHRIRRQLSTKGSES